MENIGVYRNALAQWNHRRRNRHWRLQSHPKRQTRQTRRGLCDILSQVAESNPSTGLGRWTSGRDMYASKGWLKRHPGRNYIPATKPKQWILHSISKMNGKYLDKILKHSTSWRLKYQSFTGRTWRHIVRRKQDERDTQTVQYEERGKRTNKNY